jgi:AcrR family transcriptional regulator
VARTTKAVPRAERREQLLDLALELIVTEGFEALTMEALAARAGVGKPVVYRVFPGALPLLGALVQREQRRAEAALDRCIPADPGDRPALEVLLTALDGFVEEALAAPLTWRLVLLPPEGAPKALRALVERRRANVVRRVARLVAWGRPQLGVEGLPDEELLARLIVSASQEQARIVLEDPAMAPHVRRTARVLLSAVGLR